MTLCNKLMVSLPEVVGEVLWLGKSNSINKHASISKIFCDQRFYNALQRGCMYSHSSYSKKKLR